MLQQGDVNMGKRIDGMGGVAPMGGGDESPKVSATLAKSVAQVDEAEKTVAGNLEGDVSKLSGRVSSDDPSGQDMGRIVNENMLRWRD